MPDFNLTRSVSLSSSAATQRLQQLANADLMVLLRKQPSRVSAVSGTFSPTFSSFSLHAGENLIFWLLHVNVGFSLHHLF